MILENGPGSGEFAMSEVIYGQCGQLARILKGGEVRPGDEIKILNDQQQVSLDFLGGDRKRERPGAA